MGQQIGLRKRFIVFQPNSIVSAFDMAFFFRIFVSVLVLFLVPEFSLRKISATFRLEIGQWEGVPWRIIVFQPNSIVSVSEIVFFKNFRFSARFSLCQNSVSLKLVLLFNWTWVNRCDSVRGFSFFGRIPSFQPPKWHFFQNFRFGGRFFNFFFAPEFSLR